MANDLATLIDLADLPGAPFTDAEVDAAAAAVRTAAGWHIAPQRTETVSLDVTCWERWLRLPTRKLVSVTAIRKASDSAVIDAARYEVSRRLATVKRKSSYWPEGYESTEVDMTHGYTTTPDDVLSVVAQAAVMARRDPMVRQVSIDDFSTTYRSEFIATLQQMLADYSLDNTLYGIGVA